MSSHVTCLGYNLEVILVAPEPLAFLRCIRWVPGNWCLLVGWSLSIYDQGVTTRLGTEYLQATILHVGNPDNWWFVCSISRMDMMDALTIYPAGMGLESCDNGNRGLILSDRNSQVRSTLATSWVSWVWKSDQGPFLCIVSCLDLGLWAQFPDKHAEPFLHASFATSFRTGCQKLQQSCQQVVGLLAMHRNSSAKYELTGPV